MFPRGPREWSNGACACADPRDAIASAPVGLPPATPWRMPFFRVHHEQPQFGRWSPAGSEALLTGGRFVRGVGLTLFPGSTFQSCVSSYGLFRSVHGRVQSLIDGLDALLELAGLWRVDGPPSIDLLSETFPRSHRFVDGAHRHGSRGACSALLGARCSRRDLVVSSCQCLWRTSCFRRIVTGAREFSFTFRANRRLLTGGACPAVGRLILPTRRYDRTPAPWVQRDLPVHVCQRESLLIASAHRGHVRLSITANHSTWVIPSSW